MSFATPTLTGRDAEVAQFQALLETPGVGRLLRVEGPGGIGKSALLGRFRDLCIAANRPHLSLDVRDGLAAEGEAALKSLCKNAEGLAGLRRLSEGEVWAFIGAMQEQAGGFDKLIEPLKEVLLEQLSGEGQEAVGILSQVLKMVLGVVFAGRKRLVKSVQADLKSQPEKTMLHWLALEGKRQPVLMIDTFEHALPGGAQIKTRLDLPQALSGSLAVQVQTRFEPVERFLAALIRVLMGHGWTVVVAGRKLSSLLDAPTSCPMRLQGLGPEIIAQDWLRPLFAAHGHAALDPDLLQALARQAHAASFGGVPLWLNALRAIFANSLAQGLAPSALTDNQALASAMNQSPLGGPTTRANEVRCKADILHVLFLGEDIDMAQAWRLALPERLTAARVAALLPTGDQGEALMRRLLDMGLFTGGAAPGSHHHLHEEMRDLLLWWGQSHDLSDTAETRADHRALLKVLKAERPDLAELSPVDGANADLNTRTWREAASHSSPSDQAWCHEAVKHACLGSERLRQCKPALRPEEFFEGLSSMISLGAAQKWFTASTLETLSDVQLSALTEAWRSEAAEFATVFGETIGARLARDNRLGLISGTGDVSWWLRCIEQQAHDPAAYLGLFATQSTPELQAAGIGSDEILRMMQVMLAALPASRPIGAAHVAQALNAMAIRLGQQGKPDEEIAANDEVLMRFSASQVPAS